MSNQFTLFEKDTSPLVNHQVHGKLKGQKEEEKLSSIFPAMPYSYSVSHVAGGQAQGAATDEHGKSKDDELFNFTIHPHLDNPQDA